MIVIFAFQSVNFPFAFKNTMGLFTIESDDGFLCIYEQYIFSFANDEYFVRVIKGWRLYLNFVEMQCPFQIQSSFLY